MSDADSHAEELARRLRELECLNSLVLEIARAESPDPAGILELVTRKVIAVIGVEESSIRLLAETDGNPLVTLVRNVAGQGNALDFALDQTVTGWILKERRPLVVTDIAADPRFPGLRGATAKVRSLIAAPMMLHGKVYGILSACRREAGTFDDAQVALVATIATQSAELIEAARLREQAARAERMSAELAVARRIQQAHIPRTPPSVPGYEIWATMRPALEVGGDYYDAIELPRGRIALAVGDATGKGVPAAIVVAAAQATLRAELRAGPGDAEHGLALVVGLVNRVIAGMTEPGTYVTLFVAVLDPSSGEVLYVRAGHEPAMHITAGGESRPLPEGGPPIGMVPEADYRAGRMTLGAGDSLVLFSDGLTEAARPDGEAFGDTKLASLAPVLAPLDAAALGERLLAEVSAFTAGAAPADDITVLVARRR